MAAGDIIPCTRAFTDDELTSDLASARSIVAKYKRSKRIPAIHEQTDDLLLRHEPEDYTILHPSRRSREARYAHLETVVENIESGQARRTMRTAPPPWAELSYWASDYYFENGEDERYQHESEWVKVPTEYGTVTVWANRVDAISGDGVATEGEVILNVSSETIDVLEIPVTRISQLLRRLGIEEAS